jgi:demethylmenaquinone methyltransferase/2-methoxy-6-polyprenyl-1,4-benzoquinol methylase
LANLTGKQRELFVRDMFSRISVRYDLMNRIMTIGQDVHWREEVINRAALPPHGRLLDLGAGTGDLAFECLRQFPTCRTLATDFTLEMMEVGRARKINADRQKVDWAAADAQILPFPDETFDAVVSGFLLRNLSDVPRSLREQNRVLKHGGRIVCLDTTPPSRSVLSPLIQIYLRTVIPLLGGLIAGQREAYQYLPASTESFLEPERLAARLMAAGFHGVGFRRLMFGVIAIHWGLKIMDGGKADE